MGLLWLRTASFALVLGCQPDPGGAGTSPDSNGEGSGSSTTSTTPGTATGSGSGSGAMTGSGDTTMGPGTSGSDTGPADGSSSSSTSPAPESSGGTEESGEPPLEGEPYGPCGPDSSCNGVDVACYSNVGFDMCLPPCDGTNPSCPPPPPDNESLVECVEVLGVHCMLNCAAGGDASCPTGTTCVDLGGVFRCLWP